MTTEYEHFTMILNLKMLLIVFHAGLFVVFLFVHTHSAFSGPVKQVTLKC